MSARAKAEACFALARSTTFEGERSNAIAQGTRIAEKAGLDLDTFDIPGRVRATRRPGDPTRNGLGLSPDQMEEIIRTIWENMPASMRRDRTPRYCPHGSDMALFGDTCVMCERDRRSR